MPEVIDVVVIGAGQAGLASSYCLAQRGIDHVLFEEQRVAQSWRSGRWESFCLVTPNWTVQLPGFPYQGPDPDGFMSRDEIAAYLDAYAAAFGAPVRSGTRVIRLDRTADGRSLRVEAGESTVECRAVVVATGPYQRPRLPAVAGNLPAELFQIHSSGYSNPAQLPAGAVLVVGTGQSGAQIAEELHESGREVFLSVSSCGRVPRRYRGKDMLRWAVQLGLMDRTVDMLKSPAERFVCHPHTSGKAGGHDIYLRDLGRDGVVLLGRVQSARDEKIILAADLTENLAKADEFAENVLQQLDGVVEKLGMDLPDDLNPRGIGGEVPYERRPILELDLRASGIRSVVWATGYQLDFSWIRLPVFDELGYPVQRRGVSSVPGLYFVGLEWLHKPKSGLLLGVGDDAAHVSSTIATRAET